MNETDLAARGIYPAPDWAIAAGWLGKGLIAIAVLAFALVLAESFVRSKGPRSGRAQAGLFLVGVSCLLGAMACLAALFVGNQFEYEYVASHSWRASSPIYKFAAIWAGQQGSFLLWACWSAVVGALSFRSTGPYRRAYLGVYSFFLTSLSAILVMESPFGLLKGMIDGGRAFVPHDGIGLVPSLQNYWVIVHPPTIFLGFGSLTVLFAYGAAAMIVGDLKTWAALVRPWALGSLAILGLGVVMGGLWAYETQGWGGFWAWDPVENVSLVPWLLVVAFVHGLQVQVARKKWYGTNLLMAGLPYLLFVYGTFLTRSGYLDKFSVHSFAQMDRTALWILLGLFVTVTVGYLALWAARGLRQGASLAPTAGLSGVNRESAFGAGAFLLAALSLTVAIGMSLPFFYGLMGKDAKVVAEPLYHNVVVWFYVPIMLLMALGPMLSWRRLPPREFWGRTWVALAIAALIESLFIVVLHQSDWQKGVDWAARIDFPLGLSVPRVPWVLVLFLLSGFVIAANGLQLVKLVRRSKLGVGGFLAHIGVAVTLGGLILSRGLEQQQQVLVMQGTPAQGLGYAINFERMTSNPATDHLNKAVFSLTPVGSATDFEARPSYFLTPGDDGAPTAFTSPSIDHEWNHDVYVSLETPQTNLWDAPERFQKGETKSGGGVSITFLGFRMHGRPGQNGTKVGASLRVVEDGKTYTGEPAMSVDGNSDSPQVSPSLRARIEGIDASDGSILLQMPYTHVLFPIQLFYKPMTMLVWLGAFLMAGGALLAAFGRARQMRRPAHSA